MTRPSTYQDNFPDLIAAARQTLLSSVVSQHVQLQQRGRERVGLCPFRQEATPSFYVNDSKGVYRCFGCNAAGDVIDFTRNIDGLTFREAVLQLSSGERLPTRAVVAAKPLEASLAADAERTAAAVEMWRGTQPIEGTIGETYYRRNRAITIPLPATLRFGYFRHFTGLLMPAVVGAFCKGSGKSVVAIHATFLTEVGEIKKIPLSRPRMVKGPRKGAAVRLAPFTGGKLAIAEGVETALSYMQLTGVPCWAGTAKDGIQSFIPPDDAQDIIIAADNDANGGGQLAAEAAARRWIAEGRKVEITMPETVGWDFNDVLRGGKL